MRMKTMSTMHGRVARKTLQTFWAVLAAFLMAATSAVAAGPPDGAAALPFSEAEKRFVQAHPSVRVGLIEGFEPYMFIGKNGLFQGIIPDYLRLLEARTGIAFKPARLDLAELESAMGAEIDLFPGVESPERNRYMAFTKPFISDPWVLVNHRNDPLITGLRDLQGRSISLVDNIYIHGRLESDYPDIRIHPAHDHLQALEAVSTKQADAYIGPLPVAGYLMFHKRLTHLKIAAPSGYPPAEVTFGVRNDWPELVALLDKAIATVSRQEVDAIFRKWVPVSYEREVDWTRVWQWIAGIVIGFTCLLVASLWWNRKLAQEMADRESAEQALKQIEWLLTRSVAGTDAPARHDGPPYGDVTQLNTCRIIMDAVGGKMLKRIAEDAIDLLETSVAVYEKNGDYAFGMFSSGWCRLFDPASRDLCGTDDNRKALTCGRWLCHENCWNDSAKAAMQSGKPTDIACVGGIRLYGVPIIAGNEVVGAINIGYGDPPTDEAAIRELSDRFGIPIENVRACRGAYPSRPAYIIALAKKRLRTSAALIGEIVERKRTEEELRKNQTIFKKAEELFDIGGYEYDIPSGRLVFSDGWMKIHGCEKRTLPVEELMPIAFPEDQAKIEKAFDDALKNIRPYNIEHRIVRQNDGEVRVVRVSAETIFTDDGNPVKLYGSVQDITEREAVGRALRESETKLQAILNNTEQSFALVDRKGAILAFNRIADELAKTIFGRSIQAGQPLFDFVNPADLESFKRHFRLALEGRVVAVEKEMPGGNWFAFSYNPVYDEEKAVTGVCFNSRDITVRKEAEARLNQYSNHLEEMVAARTHELEKAQEELLLKERLAVLGNLSGSISHELRNPLAAIDSSVYLLRMRLGEDGDRVHDLMDRIQVNTMKANGIIQSLLDLTRMEGPRTQPRDLRDLVPDLIRNLGAPDGIRIETVYADAEVPADVDARQIRMALKNIMENGIQAMGGDGTLSVSVQRAECGTSAIVVSDTGPGIPPEEVQKIFQPLFSTKVHGIGFGLSIAKTIIEKHGGDLTAESIPDKGATFTIALPGARKESKRK